MPNTTADQIIAGIKSLIEQGQDRDSVNEIVGNSIADGEFISVDLKNGIAAVASDDDEGTAKFKITIDIKAEQFGEWFARSWPEDLDSDDQVNDISGPHATREAAIEHECTGWCTGEPDDPTYHAEDATDPSCDGELEIQPRGPHGGERITVVVSQDRDSLPDAPE
jgi:hypothetical protein